MDVHSHLLHWLHWNDFSSPQRLPLVEKFEHLPSGVPSTGRNEASACGRTVFRKYSIEWKDKLDDTAAADVANSRGRAKTRRKRVALGVDLTAKLLSLARRAWIERKERKFTNFLSGVFEIDIPT